MQFKQKKGNLREEPINGTVKKQKNNTTSEGRLEEETTKGKAGVGKIVNYESNQKMQKEST